MRIFAVSDIHVDFEENARWVEGLSSWDFQEDALIVAGDVSDQTDRLASCFESLCSKFRYVLFLPGNHELWLKKGENIDSLEKFHQVLALAESFGVITKRSRIGGFTFVPLFAWYDFSFGQPNEFLKMAWVDFKRCRWPDKLAYAHDICEVFLQMNDLSPVNDGTQVISYSHFLPRIDLMPHYIPEDKQQIYPVLGCDSLDVQIRALSSKLHIYGHSHLNRSIDIDGVHYLNNAFAYPHETRIARKQLMDLSRLTSEMA